MDLEDFETYPWGRLAFKTLIDSVKAKNLTKTCYTVDGFIQTRVVNYEPKEIDEMFPKWDNDESDVVVENLVKFMFAAKGKWKWTQECWPVEGAKKWTNPVYVKQERPQPTVNEERRAQPTVNEERRAQKKARTEAYTESHAAARNGITREEIEQKVMTAGFGQCVEEVKLLGGRMEALENKRESVNGDKGGRENNVHAANTEPGCLT
uniref:DUF1985 domain-containing protein n=1 Tax=Brassica oleracea var. oleracea TaxID=109376 RepID=A0A0D3AXP0_BRAOL